MSIKTVEKIVSPDKPHFVGDGFHVHNYIPSIDGLDMNRLNPFIMMDYNAPYHFPPSDVPRGVGVHPHRGFETVTIAYKGSISHHDSSGGGGTLEEGDVQWMTAAKGVLHKEYHEKEWSKKGGLFQMVQLWINLPAKDKMSPPKYQSIKNQMISKIHLDQNNGEIEIIAGEYKGIKGTAETFTPIHMFNAKIKKGAVVPLDFPKEFNTLLLVIEGSILINSSQSAIQNHLVLMANDGHLFEIEATEDTTVLILSADSINEPIAAHGPFVMNTRNELMQAFLDYENGLFGFLED